MLSLLELVSQNQPHFQTHQALLVIGLQNDFLQPDGKLPVSTRSGFLDRIHALIPTFRQQSSNVIWIKTLYEADRLVNPMADEGDGAGGPTYGPESSTDEDDDLSKDPIQQTQSRSSKHKQRALDLLKRVSARRRAPREGALAAVYEDDDVEDELFLRKSAKTGPACLPQTPGAEFVETLLPKIEQSDTVVQTTDYSAFQGTSLLLILRARLVTELYICGCITNVSVLATVMDAARHGIRINVVGDCLGYRKQSRHEIALKRMVEFFDADIVTSTEVVDRHRPQGESERNSQDDVADEERLQGLVDKMRLTEASSQRTASIDTKRSTGDSPAITINGRQRKASDASVADSRTTLDTALTDEQFADKLVQGAKLDPSHKQSTAKQSLVKSKIRMRTRSDKSKKSDESKPESSKRGEQKGEATRGPATVDKHGTQDPVPRSPKTASVPEGSRPKSLTKAGSISKLRDSFSGPDRPLKLSASQPALSSSRPESRDMSTTSRVRLALSRRSSKSDLNRALPHPPPSPAKSAIGQPYPASAPTPDPSVSRMGKPSKLQSLATFPTLGPGDHIAEGDSRIIYDFFSCGLYHPTDPSKPLKDLIFTQLYNEVRWQKMLHQQGEVPRLVCCQGEFSADGSMPIYRHPADQTLPLLHFSPKVDVVRKQAEKMVGHPLNHVLIQLYRSGNDFISEHSDKTLDIAKGSSIVNVSFGAQRTMRLRTKKSAKVGDADERSQRETQRVALPHNSIFVLGLKSNEKWLHGIMADKRQPGERSEAESAYSGIRISLTFRHINTFLDARNTIIWGQGATSKDQRNAGDVVNDDEEETERIVRAFGRENHSSQFDWDECYGDGFDVLHLHAPPKDLPILYESYNEVEIKMIKIFFAEKKMEYTVCEAPALDKQYEVDRQVGYRDNDANHTETVFAMPIVLYLDRYHPLDQDDRGRSCTSLSYYLFIQISAMMKFWHNREVPTYFDNFLSMLEALEERTAFGTGPFIAGRRFSIGDCGTWPALDELIMNWTGWTEERFPTLTEYYKMCWKKKKSVQMFRAELPPIRKSAKGKAADRTSAEEEL
jgi:nicotinamidase-related amidase/alkylated DNA repair dioxygenase AlkB